jgi:hypothetical protein
MQELLLLPVVVVVVLHKVVEVVVLEVWDFSPLLSLSELHILFLLAMVAKPQVQEVIMTVILVRILFGIMTLLTIK